MNFFKEEERKRKEGEEYPLNETVLDVLRGLKEKEKEDIFINEQGDEKDINLYKLVVATETPVDLLSADDAFSRYIKTFHALSTKGYFEILVKFIALFREFINEKNNEVANASTETHNVFSMKDGAGKLPEYCNEFVSEFLEKRKEIDIKDSIDLIQHFCFWLHENNYTKSVLSLLTNN